MPMRVFCSKNVPVSGGKCNVDSTNLTAAHVQSRSLAYVASKSSIPCANSTLKQNFDYVLWVEGQFELFSKYTLGIMGFVHLVPEIPICGPRSRSDDSWAIIVSSPRPQAALKAGKM